MTKFYGPDEGFQTKINRGTLKAEKSTETTAVSYSNSNIRVDQ
jgi:hypothetical protein